MKKVFLDMEYDEMYPNNLGFATKTRNGFRFSYADSCRESFHSEWYGRERYILYRTPNPKWRNHFRRFIHMVEKKIGVKRSTVYRTNRFGVLLIIASPFWASSEVRKEFFSIVLRAAATYNGSNFYNCLYRNRYFKETRPATTRFLQGYTQFKERPYNSMGCVYDGYEKGYWNDGWVSTFFEVGKIGAKHMLVKPR